MRDYYDIYILTTINRNTLNKDNIINAIIIKAKERDTLDFIRKHKEYLHNINNSPEMHNRWKAYAQDYPYAKGIEFDDIVKLIEWLFEGCDNNFI